MTLSSETMSEGPLYCPTCERTFASGEHCPDDATRLVSLETNDAMIGRVLDGRYTLISKLGVGGMGAVYRATQHSVGRDVAIKVIAPNLISNALAIKRFLREAKLASRLAHPNAVAVLDFGQTSDHVFYLVMELVEGRTLEQLLAVEPVLPLARVIRIGTQICDALEGAHALQIIHRDLKPANVMLLPSGRDLVKVLDFGIAKSLTANDTKMTTTGAAVGTPSFMPPEVATGDELDARADLYSLGCMLYLMATGTLPFVADSVQDVLWMQVAHEPKPMYGVPDPLAAIVLRLLEKDRDRRFPTAAATREALEAALYDVLPSRPNVVAALSASGEPTTVSGVPGPDTRAPAVESAEHVRPVIERTPLLVPWDSQSVEVSPPTRAAVDEPRKPRRPRWAIAAAAVAAVGVGVAVFAALSPASRDEPADHPEPGTQSSQSLPAAIVDAAPAIAAPADALLRATATATAPATATALPPPSDDAAHGAAAAQPAKLPGAIHHHHHAAGEKAGSGSDDDDSKMPF